MVRGRRKFGLVVFGFGYPRGLGGQEDSGEQRPGQGDGRGDDAPNAKAVVEGAGSGLVHGGGRGALAMPDELAGDTERRPGGLAGEGRQGVRVISLLRSIPRRQRAGRRPGAVLVEP
jgi:hypothetical protein